MTPIHCFYQKLHFTKITHNTNTADGKLQNPLDKPQTSDAEYYINNVSTIRR